RKVNEASSTLGPVFTNNVKKSTEAFTLWIEDEADLAGLPATVVESAKQEAVERGDEGKWLITLDYPSFGPFITYSSRRDLREKIWKANSNKAFRDQFDNTETLLKIVELRHKRAQLLGY
ncbi:MAG: M3 family peptidase, partial [Alphaproteobacteria bacterium]|nr:M3 family peptidase [Alphaproteobacteria bacterium]